MSKQFSGWVQSFHGTGPRLMEMRDISGETTSHQKLPSKTRVHFSWYLVGYIYEFKPYKKGLEFLLTHSSKVSMTNKSREFIE